MRIKRLSYTNKATGWDLKPISFGPLTLLVGASGVGKTRILESILDLKRISRGETLNGVVWSVEFETTSGNQCKWEGEFENKGSSFYPGDEKEDPKIEQERVFIKDKLIVDRNQDGIIFNGVRTVKLAPNESVMFLLKEEDWIEEIHKELSKIISDNDADNQDFDNSGNVRLPSVYEMDKRSRKYKSIQEIKDSGESVDKRLYFAYKNKKEVFERIARAFIEIFSYVEAIKIEPIAEFSDIGPFVQIKEKGVRDWIDETNISSGMLKTLMHIAELYLSPDSSVILIDEFENGLGINCIDEVTSSIVSAGRDLQFVITSHHPYIINNIDQTHWKIIARQGGSVVAHDTSEFRFDKSKHKAFTQLMNLDIYEEGVVL